MELELGFTSAKQELYHLSCISILLGFFGYGLNLFALAGLEP
jgi:hypothetical protein